MDYTSLQKKYDFFKNPRVKILLGDQDICKERESVVLDDLHIELTSEYEASVATFRLYGVYDQQSKAFSYDKLKNTVVMGNSVSIYLGYLNVLELVFVGFICAVSFHFSNESASAYIEVTCMDVKGVMMGGAYAAQLKATTYSAAVKEVLDRTAGGKLQQMGGITQPPQVSATPDAAPGALKSPDKTVEMVNESDYEFVVRAAKRYNFEFFIDRGKALFRPAKSDSSVLMTLDVTQGVLNFDVEYSLTGIVGEIEARAINPAKAQLIRANEKFSNTISTGGKAKNLVGKGVKVYLDASITSEQDARARVESLMEQMSYRLGSLEALCIGIPDLIPGRFIETVGMGAPADNRFYLTHVIHDFSGQDGFQTQIRGCAAQVQSESSAGGIGGLL